MKFKEMHTSIKCFVLNHLKSDDEKSLIEKTIELFKGSITSSGINISDIEITDVSIYDARIIQIPHCFLSLKSN